MHNRAERRRWKWKEKINQQRLLYEWSGGDVAFHETYHRKYWRVQSSWRRPLNKNPTWFDRLYNNKPKRHEEKQLSHLIVKGDLNPENVMWPDDDKPCLYYW